MKVQMEQLFSLHFYLQYVSLYYPEKEDERKDLALIQAKEMVSVTVFCSGTGECRTVTFSNEWLFLIRFERLKNQLSKIE